MRLLLGFALVIPAVGVLLILSEDCAQSAAITGSAITTGLLGLVITFSDGRAVKH